MADITCIQAWYCEPVNWGTELSSRIVGGHVCIYGVLIAAVCKCHLWSSCHILDVSVIARNTLRLRDIGPICLIAFCNVSITVLWSPLNAQHFRVMKDVSPQSFFFFFFWGGGGGGGVLVNCICVSASREILALFCAVYFYSPGAKKGTAF